MQTIYISTPINSRREKTFREKREAAARRCKWLRLLLTTEWDCKVVTPFDVIPLDTQMEEEEALGRCITALLRCDAVYLDHGWTGSKGCNLEYRAAKLYDKIIYEHDKT